ncbi:MAG: thiosulfate oxidation carrier protein SoxY [Pseudomonadota bacterium]
MNMDRRQFVLTSAAAFAALSVNAVPAFAANGATADDRIKEFTGGAEIAEGRVTLNTPEIAENGNTVPISVEVDSPMTDDNYVQSIMVVADGNPNPEVVTFNFTTMSGVAAAKTRIRLAKTQNVIAVAKLSDGSFQMAKNEVKVTIGGCGG